MTTPSLDVHGFESRLGISLEALGPRRPLGSAPRGSRGGAAPLREESGFFVLGQEAAGGLCAQSCMGAGACGSLRGYGPGPAGKRRKTEAAPLITPLSPRVVRSGLTAMPEDASLEDRTEANASFSEGAGSEY